MMTSTVSVLVSLLSAQGWPTVPTAQNTATITYSPNATYSRSLSVGAIRGLEHGYGTIGSMKSLERPHDYLKVRLPSLDPLNTAWVRFRVQFRVTARCDANIVASTEEMLYYDPIEGPMFLFGGNAATASGRIDAVEASTSSPSGLVVASHQLRAQVVGSDPSPWQFDADPENPSDKVADAVMDVTAIHLDAQGAYIRVPLYSIDRAMGDFSVISTGAPVAYETQASAQMESRFIFKEILIKGKDDWGLKPPKLPKKF